MLKYFKRFFSTVKLTIYLLTILSIASIIGTLVQQNQPPNFYMRAYGNTAYKILTYLSITDIYHSWWFSLLLLLLAINLLVCSINRLPQAIQFIRNKKSSISPEKLKAMQYHFELNVDSDFNIISEKLSKWFAKAFQKCKQEINKTRISCFAEKGLIGRFGFFMVHLSIIIILLGGIIGLLWGFRGNMIIVEGEMANKVRIPSKGKIITLPFTVKCEKFKIEYYENTDRPKTYESYVSIFEKSSNKPKQKAIIRVNHPLYYKGIRIYQASYGKTAVSNKLMVVIKNKHTKNVQTITANVGDKISLDNGKLHLTVVDYKPDFIIGTGGHIITRSFEPNNPALELEVKEKGAEPYRTWVFAKYPRFHGTKESSEYIISFVGPKIKFYTGLEVSKDPGVNFVWTGCILLIGGLIIVFFIPHKRIWLTATKTKGKTNIILAGTVSRGQFDFKMYFNNLCEELKNHLQ